MKLSKLVLHETGWSRDFPTRLPEARPSGPSKGRHVGKSSQKAWLGDGTGRQLLDTLPCTVGEPGGPPTAHPLEKLQPRLSLPTTRLDEVQIGSWEHGLTWTASAW